MAELWELPAGDLTRLVGAGEVSAREVVQAHLDRIADVNPRVNAITAVLEREALDAADAADRALREGAEPGPLCGVPMTVKENVDVKGSATTHGIVPLRNAVAERDSPHVAQLRAAGAIPIGRTNMPEFGMRWHTDNALHGPTRNPWSAAHTPGASSGGEAVAVATGLSPLGVGSDGAGSLRWPAQCCGVAALKPSLGRVALTGPALPFGFQLLAVHGPMARRVADLRLAFEHMCGPVPADPWHAPAPLRGPALGRGVAVVTDDHAVRRAAELLADAGYQVEEGRPPALERAAEIYFQIMSAYGRVQEEQPPVETVASPDFVRFWAGFEKSWSEAGGRAAFDPMMERAAIHGAWAAWMAATPLVLMPIVPDGPFRVGEDLEAGWAAAWPGRLRTTVAVNLLGLPSVAVPVGEAGGLPQVVQIVGPRFREDLCLDAAAAIEARAPRLTPLDPRD
ncbi:amidase [Nonomuraea rhizosphaerae]|uniref:amidase n=1 Tax=Nonomuraea rhizosphaerae TaxID=2665663 RepID=UPI001C5F3841|nr:amidase [Nonomuraea rhizosphaerae]